MPTSQKKAAVVNNSPRPQWRDESKENVKGTFCFNVFTFFFHFFTQFHQLMLEVENKSLLIVVFFSLWFQSKCHVSMWLHLTWKATDLSFLNWSCFRLRYPLIGVLFDQYIFAKYHLEFFLFNQLHLTCNTALHSVHCSVLRCCSWSVERLYTGPASDLPR